MKKETIDKIKYDFKNVSITLLFLTFFIQCESYSQEWINNYITEYYANKLVMDFGFTGNSLWILGDNLTRIDNEEITEFYFDSNSTGCIYDYQSPNKYYYFDNILTGKNKIWLWNYRDQNYLMIRNDSVYSLRFDREKYSRILFEDNILDEHGNMFIITEEPDLTKNKFKIFYSNGKSNFADYHLPLNLDNDSNFHLSFIKQNNLRYLIKYKYRLEKFDLFIFDIYDSLIKKFESIKCGPPPNSLNYYINDKNIYLLSGGGKLFHLNTNLQLYEYNIPYSSKKGECYWFIINDDDLYYSSLYGFYKYNLKTSDSSSIKEISNYRYDLFNVSFRNMKIKGDFLYGNYNGYNNLACGLLSLQGIYIYRIK